MRSFSHLMVVLATGVLGSVAQADLIATAELAGPTGSPHKITVAGSPTTDVAFSFDVYVTANFDMNGAQMVIQDLDASGIFNLTGVTFDTGAGWDNFWGFPDRVLDGLGNPTSELLTPDAMNANPGGISSGLFGTLSAGPYVAGGVNPIHFMTIDAVVLAGAAPGTYNLNLAEVIVGDYLTYGDVAGGAGANLQVEVVAIPAPPAVWLGGAGLLFAAWLRKRTMTRVPVVATCAV